MRNVAQARERAAAAAAVSSLPAPTPGSGLVGHINPVSGATLASLPSPTMLEQQVLRAVDSLNAEVTEAGKRKFFVVYFPHVEALHPSVAAQARSEPAGAFVGIITAGSMQMAELFGRKVPLWSALPRLPASAPMRSLLDVSGGAAASPRDFVLLRCCPRRWGWMQPSTSTGSWST